MKPSPFRELIVDESGHAARLDVYLARVLPAVTRRRARALVDAGEVTVNGKRARKGDALRAGDAVAIWSEPIPESWSPLPAPEIELVVLREEESFLAIEKPSGIPSVPLDPDEPGTLAGAVAARFPECAALGRSPGDGGLLQRLDRGTSGLVLVARTEEAFQALSAAQRRNEIEKVYAALVARRDGPWPERIEAPLEAAGKGGAGVRVGFGGTAATTWIRSTEDLGAFCLVEAVIHRGGRHQIRAHLAHLGSPIAGDDRYGGPAVPGLARLFLHACEVSAPHPETSERFTIASKLPEPLVGVLRALGRENGVVRSRLRL